MADGAAAERAARPIFGFDNSYARDLPGFSLAWSAAQVPAPHLLRLNRGLAEELGLDPDALSGADGDAWFSGNAAPPGAMPVAQAYAGHQFGGFSPQLGDGRALLLGEVIDRAGQRRDIALKGSGPTPFSRRGDGKAVLGPVLREYLMGEAMHALGIPTTRALAVVATGETVMREVPLPGAVLTRVAASHIRVGTFQFFSARGEADRLRLLTDYTIARHYPELEPGDALGLLAAVAGRQARLIAQWMQVGFIHGVMNTDNMALSGETIDYGPCAFMDAYDPATVFSSIDHTGRYAWGNQPVIGQWNLARLAETLLPQIDADSDRAVQSATEVLRGYLTEYEAAWLAGVRARLGLVTTGEGDRALADALLAEMQAQGADWTLSFRHLGAAARGDATAFLAQFADPKGARDWLGLWQARLTAEARDPEQVAQEIEAVSPAVIPRNHLVEESLSAAVEIGDLAPFDALVAAVTDPFGSPQGRERFALPPPQGFGQGYRTFCGT
jgi:serine/tyrosine/threonine adenylyltransferase